MGEYYINYGIIKDFEVYIDFSKKEYFQIEYNLKKIINFINNNSENIYKKIDSLDLIFISENSLDYIGLIKKNFSSVTNQYKIRYIFYTDNNVFNRNIKDINSDNYFNKKNFIIYFKEEYIKNLESLNFSFAYDFKSINVIDFIKLYKNNPVIIDLNFFYIINNYKIEDIIIYLETIITYLKKLGYNESYIIELFGLPDNIEDIVSFSYLINFNENISEVVDVNIINNYYIIRKEYILKEIQKNDLYSIKILNKYLIKKLYINRFKKNTNSLNENYKKLTYLEKYFYSNEIYPHEKIWYYFDSTKVYETWKNFLIGKNDKQKIGITVNIPFCETKCMYCTHNVIVGKKDKYDEYLNNLEKQMIIYSNLFQNVKIDSLYIGGGTPTVLSSEQLDRLYSMLFKYYNLEKISRNMIEFSPNTYSEDKVKIIYKYAVNRVTFGIQDIDNDIMKLNNRIQKKESVEDLLISLKYYGVEYINVDIMAGLKGQTLEHFKDTLDFCLNNKNIDDICLNIYKPTDKTGYTKYGDNFFTKEYILERNKMIEYWKKQYSNKKENIVGGESNLYNFDEPNYSFLSLGYGSNGHIFGKLYYKYESLEKYYRFCNNDVGYLVGYEIVSEDEIIKYIILNLKENGISFIKMEKIFGNVVYGEYIKKGLDRLNKKGLIDSFEKEGKKYYRFNKDSQREYEIYSKYFYRDELLKDLIKINAEDLYIDSFLDYYFVN